MNIAQGLLRDSSYYFNDNNVRSGLKQKRKLGTFINELIIGYRSKANIVSYTFIDDEALLAINQINLQHDTYTDIITFDLSGKKDAVLLADIFICIVRVKDNAQQLNIPYQHELLRVIIHGALHICGFKDKTAKNQQKMRLLEDGYMQKYLALP